MSTKFIICGDSSLPNQARQASQSRSRRLRLQGQPSTSLKKRLEDQKAREETFRMNRTIIPDELEAQTVLGREENNVREGEPVLEMDYDMQEQDEEQETSRQESTVNEPVQRKARALLEILQAGPKVEDTIKQYASEIDETMLELLYRRIEAAKDLEQNEEAIQGLLAVASRLKAELDRQKASPSMRLLDSLLNILMQDDIMPERSNEEETAFFKTSEEEKVSRFKKYSGTESRRLIAARLQAAFSSIPIGDDVISVASKLASGGAAVADQFLEENITADAFIHEVTVLLEHAMEQQRQLEMAIEQMETSQATHSEREEYKKLACDRALALTRIVDSGCIFKMEAEEDRELQLALALSLQECPDSSTLPENSKDTKKGSRNYPGLENSGGKPTKHDSATRGTKGRRSNRAIADYRPTDEEIHQSFIELTSSDRLKITPTNILTMAKKLGLDLDREGADTLFEYAIEYELISSSNSRKEISMDEFFAIAHHFETKS